MKTAILTVGTEILFGQIVNTNAAWISQQLQNMGYDVMYHYSVGDNPGRLKELIDFAFHDCNNLTNVTFQGTMADLSSIRTGNNNAQLLNASWGFGPLGTMQIMMDSLGASLLFSCLINGGIVIACLVIYIRQRKYPFL